MGDKTGLILELQAVKIGIKPTTRQKVRMRATVKDAAFVHDHNDVGCLDR